MKKKKKNVTFWVMNTLVGLIAVDMTLVFIVKSPVVTIFTILGIAGFIAVDREFEKSIADPDWSILSWVVVFFGHVFCLLVALTLGVGTLVLR